MNVNAIRYYYEYHFTENQRLWDTCRSSLTLQQLIEDVDYSHGSIRNQIVHIMSVDDTWFCGLRGQVIPESLNPTEFISWDSIRAYWDNVEQTMRSYLANLRDDMLFEKPFADGEDKDLILWQVLLHVINHGTDHRAQILRILHDLGVKTTSQDFIFYVYDNV